MYCENGWELRKYEDTSMLRDSNYPSIDIPVLVEQFPGMLGVGKLKGGEEEKVPIGNEGLGQPLNGWYGGAV